MAGSSGVSGGGCLLCSREQQIGTLDWDRRRERRPGAADRNSGLGRQTGEADGSSIQEHILP
ncbi:MAG: hypothetical protein LUE94_09255 [Clostridiales bacterium]|nr:hypothetical protein [Clostridiales bacterium]